MLKKRLEELLAFAESTDLQEVVWEKKGPSSALGDPLFLMPIIVRRPARPTANKPFPKKPLQPVEPMVIKSAMVGTFYRSDAPTRPPMVVEGTIVAAGQPVGAIEAMKIMKDVVAPTACKIIKALVANGHPVEYGQPLFQIEPEPNV